MLPVNFGGTGSVWKQTNTLGPNALGDRYRVITTRYRITCDVVDPLVVIPKVGIQSYNGGFIGSLWF